MTLNTTTPTSETLGSRWPSPRLKTKCGYLDLDKISLRENDQTKKGVRPVCESFSNPLIRQVKIFAEFLVRIDEMCLIMILTAWLWIVFEYILHRHCMQGVRLQYWYSADFWPHNSQPTHNTESGDLRCKTKISPVINWECCSHAAECFKPFYQVTSHNIWDGPFLSSSWKETKI